MKRRNKGPAHTGMSDVAHNANLQTLKRALFLPDGIKVKQSLGADAVTPYLDEALPDLDVVYMLRIQMERLESAPFPSLREYNLLYGLTRERERLMKEDAIICHPGPINRGVELDSYMADGSHSVIVDQVFSGVCVRMALIYLLLGGSDENAR